MIYETLRTKHRDHKIILALNSDLHIDASVRCREDVRWPMVHHLVVKEAPRSHRAEESTPEQMVDHALQLCKDWIDRKTAFNEVLQQGSSET